KSHGLGLPLTSVLRKHDTDKTREFRGRGEDCLAAPCVVRSEMAWIRRLVEEEPREWKSGRRPGEGATRREHIDPCPGKVRCGIMHGMRVLRCGARRFVSWRDARSDQTLRPRANLRPWPILETRRTSCRRRATAKSPSISISVAKFPQ